MRIHNTGKNIGSPREIIEKKNVKDQKDDIITPIDGTVT
jgi:hypothetical protein